MNIKKSNDLIRAIEKDFPFIEVSKIAEKESWRKDIYRPIYYLHKWWAKRLGSVFRAILIGSCVDGDESIFNLFYKKHNFNDLIIYDPMMGSGVTIGEARKLGCKVIGRDINSVSYLLVKSFLNNYEIEEVINTFNRIKKDVSEQIKSYYKTQIKTKENDDLTYKEEIVDVLYYFWVKIVTCPKCDGEIDLFSNRIFVKHAYPLRNPEAKSLCPHCETVNSIILTDTNVICNRCSKAYDPHQGVVYRNKVTCPHCEYVFAVIDAVRSKEYPPKHRMYAKSILNENGKKEYLSINEFDLDLYEKASNDLKKMNINIPKIKISSGYNTKQIINYKYLYWHQLFNYRQLLCLGILRDRIKKIKDETMKELFSCFFSGCLEFNNMFCSFKGEGTGAVRHMFSHHILNPERRPLEANLWGTPKSSGSFSTLFKSRVLRALDYKNNPFELAISAKDDSTCKIFDINKDLSGYVSNTYSEFKTNNGEIYLSCGSSDSTDIEDGIVDVVVTDPPFFNNVHYSELADFFYVWQRDIFDKTGLYESETTRSEKEVQDGDPDHFSEKLTSVYKDCNRVLNNSGILVFTFHHSNTLGWISILESLYNSNFYVETSYPVKSEMSVSLPLSKSKNPNNYDMIIICRKKYIYHKSLRLHNTYLLENIPLLTSERAKLDTINAVEKIKSSKLKISSNDVKCIYIANLMSTLTRVKDLNIAKKYLCLVSNEIEEFSRTYNKLD